MKSLPFGKPGRWFRGNLHTHSTNSDGKKSPAQVCAWYQRHGYDFISLTDHFLENYGWPITDTTTFRTKGFTTIIGAEIHAPKTSLGGQWHILAVGLPFDFAQTGRRESGPKLAQRARDAGAYVAAAHPAWYDLTDRDILSLKAAHAIEIFNTTCSVHNGKGDSTGYLDRLLSQDHRYHAIATDDAHSMSDAPDMGRNWVMVRSRRSDPASLLAALHSGSFYASQGPNILDMKFARGRKLTVRTSPVRSVYVSGRSSMSAYFNARRDVTSTVLDLSDFKGTYGRLTVTDKQGRRAWSNPFYL